MPFHPAQRFWDGAYERGEHVQHWDCPAAAPELAALLADGIPRPGATVLDVGCGAGSEVVFLAARGFRALGVDLSAKALEIAGERARRAGVEVDLRRGDALDLPVAHGSVDLVLDRGCFHLLPRRRRGRYAREVERVLRPGGALLLRGAAADCEEAGLVAVDAAEVDRWFDPQRFSRGPLEPLVLAAPAGDLEAHQVLLMKRPETFKG